MRNHPARFAGPGSQRHPGGGPRLRLPRLPALMEPRVAAADAKAAACDALAGCVMLNKRPHVVEAVQALDDILRRMQGHQHKKSARLRALHLAQSGL